MARMVICDICLAFLRRGDRRSHADTSVNSHERHRGAAKIAPYIDTPRPALSYNLGVREINPGRVQLCSRSRRYIFNTAKGSPKIHRRVAVV